MKHDAYEKGLFCIPKYSENFTNIKSDPKAVSWE